MNKAINIFVAFVILGLGGCAALPVQEPPEPPAPQGAIIGISVKMRAPIKIGSYKADRVYFIKVDKEEDLYNQQNLILSNYFEGSQVYLLNAKPGRYAAVVVFGSPRKSTAPGTQPSGGGVSIGVGFSIEAKHTAFLSEEIIKLTEVTVAPESMVFMGEYVVDTSIGFKDADDAQLHYKQLVAPGAKTDVLSMAFSSQRCYTGYLHKENRDEQAEIKFLTNALEQFKGSDWINIIQKRIEELKAEK